jgi:signal transduction histidine kinase
MVAKCGLNGGKMWAENSNPDGEGATFSFSLPINDVKSAID